MTGVVLDGAALPTDQDHDAAVRELNRRFPSLAIVFIQRPDLDPWVLLRLGRAGIRDLVLVHLDALARDLPRGTARSGARSTASLLARAIGVGLPAKERLVLRIALDGALLGWGADDLATYTGWTRAHLSVRLRAHGLPSAGHLLTWAKLLHAGSWLSDPGRSADSISRQLGYSSGAAFRRALHNYVGGTPRAVRERGALHFVLGRFLDVCGLSGSVRADQSVA